MHHDIIAIIPARYASTRLPGKPLIDIAGKPMIQWVYERTAMAKNIDAVIVATDDERIFDTVVAFGGQAEMTPSDLASGTDRVAFVAENLSAHTIINVQGDEPLIDPQAVDLAADVLLKDDQAVMGTLVTKISNENDLTDENCVRVVFDRNHRALYFSRSVIPFARGIVPQKSWIDHIPYYLHIGIYSYRREFLLTYKDLPFSVLEQAEKLEQLRALENGYTIKVGVTDFHPVSVDVPQDIDKVQTKLKEMGYE